MASKAVKEFKAFESMFRKVVRASRYESRRKAEHTLRPQLFKKMAEGRLQPDEIVKMLGSKPKTQGGEAFTLADLQKFDAARKKTVAKYDASTAGAPLYQLLAACWSEDLKRAKKEIASAVLYRTSGHDFSFRTNAGPDSNHTNHQVRIRLEEWRQYLVSSEANYVLAVKRACEGRLSFDCDCGRHQYWFRYIATIGNYALKPYEEAFPKIRNPGLGGACCKHVIKVLYALRSPVTHTFMAREMEKQAAEIGFGDDKKRTKFLADKDRAELEAIDLKDLTKKDIEAEFKQFKQAQEAFAKKLAEPETQKAMAEMKAELAKAKEGEKKAKEDLRKMEEYLSLKEREREEDKRLLAKQAEEFIRGLERDAKLKEEASRRETLINKLHVKITVATHVTKTPQADVIALFAKENNMTVAEVEKMGREANIIK